MRNPWYRKDPETYDTVRREIEDAYPGLHFLERGDRVVITGSYSLVEDGRVWDRYRIEVRVPEGSPQDIPVVRELDRRVPWRAERHMEPDGRACVVLPDAFLYEHPEGMSLLEFLNGPLRSFLASQSLIELGETDPWPSGEWGHGVEGILQFYEHLLGITGKRTVRDYLDFLSRKRVKGHWDCPCGSGRRLRYCHRDLVMSLRDRIPPPVARASRDHLDKPLGEARTGEAQKIRSYLSQ